MDEAMTNQMMYLAAWEFLRRIARENRIDKTVMSVPDLQFIKRYIRKIKVYPNGKLSVVFYNRAEITAIGETDDGSNSTETSHEN